MPTSNPPDLQKQAADLTIEETLQLAAFAAQALVDGIPIEACLSDIPKDDDKDD